MAQATIEPKKFSAKFFAWLIIFVGIVGLVASFVLTQDKIHILTDPSYSPPCNINPVFSCGSVVRTWQAEAFGFPNTFIGMAAFAVLITIGACMLFGAKMSKRFWQLFQVGALFGLGFILFLFINSVYRINAICLYCMGVWTVIILLNWYTLLWNIQNKTFKLPSSLQKPHQFARRHHLDILAAIYFIVGILIINHFWYYFGPH